MTAEFILTLQAQNPGARLEFRAGAAWLEADGLDVVGMAQYLRGLPARLSTISAVARVDGETDIIYHYTFGQDAVNVKTRTRGNAIPSITPECPAAGWIEREIHDLFAVDFVGHPNLARLVLPDGIEPGFFREPKGPRPERNEPGAG